MCERGGREGKARGCLCRVHAVEFAYIILSASSARQIGSETTAFYPDIRDQTQEQLKNKGRSRNISHIWNVLEKSSTNTSSWYLAQPRGGVNRRALIGQEALMHVLKQLP